MGSDPAYHSVSLFEDETPVPMVGCGCLCSWYRRSMAQTVLNIQEPGDSNPRFQLKSDGSTTASPDGVTNVEEGFFNLAPAFQQSGTATGSPGVYVQPQSEQVGTLTTALSSGTPYTSLSVSATAFPILAGTTLQITYLTNTQNVTVSGSSTIPAGSTSIPVTSFTPTVTYPSGSPVNLTIIYNILEVADKSGSPIMWVSNAGAGIGTAGAPIVCNTSGLVAAAYLDPTGNVAGAALTSIDGSRLATLNVPFTTPNVNQGITAGPSGPPLIGERPTPLYKAISASEPAAPVSSSSWALLSSSPSITLPEDGNVYRVDMFAHVFLASAAIGAVGVLVTLPPRSLLLQNAKSL